jgi:hypothetical protein
MGIGKPGKMPFFWSIRKVKYDPARTAMTERAYETTPKYKSIIPQSIE